MEQHGFKQEKVAEVLGISQSAVSKYTRHVRGHMISIDSFAEAKPFVASMTEMFASGTFERDRFLQLFCQTCHALRKTGAMCSLCRKVNTNVEIEDCVFCLAGGDSSV